MIPQSLNTVNKRLGLDEKMVEANEFLNKKLNTVQEKIIYLGDISKVTDLNKQVESAMAEKAQEENLFLVFACRNKSTEENQFPEVTSKSIPGEIVPRKSEFVNIYSQELLAETAKKNNLKLKVFGTPGKNAINLALVYRITTAAETPETEKPGKATGKNKQLPAGGEAEKPVT